jgi:hypothetical protein
MERCTMYSYRGGRVVKSVRYVGQTCHSAMVWNLLGQLCTVEFFQY